MIEYWNGNPKTTAMMVIDLQKGYCDPKSDMANAPLNWDVSRADALCHATKDFLDAARQFLPPRNIIFTQMEESIDTYAPNSPYVFDTENFVPLCVRGTEGHEFHIVEPVDGIPQVGEVILFKTHPSAFHSTAKIIKGNRGGAKLDSYLKWAGIETIAFIGVIESRCISASINGASERGYKCLALRDFMASPIRDVRGGDLSFEDEARASRQVEDMFSAKNITGNNFVKKLRSFNI